MSRPIPSLLAAVLAATALAAPLAAHAADAEVVDMPPGITAKMARMKSKMLDRHGRDRDDDEGRGRGSGAQCGALEVGNVNTGGRRTGAPRQVNVFVTGPVINANNKCR